jgi:hypothetical protein
MAALIFRLEVEDRWPPVSKEGIACSKRRGGYRIDVAPFFIRKLSVGDVVEVDLDSEGCVSAWSHVSRSARSIAWILVKGAYDIESALSRLKKKKCNIERFTEYGLFAIDIPETCSLDDFDRCLAPLDASKFSLVFPSLRHE